MSRELARGADLLSGHARFLCLDHVGYTVSKKNFASTDVARRCERSAMPTWSWSMHPFPRSERSLRLSIHLSRVAALLLA